jgi:glycosyltransferase involved in cell wall biosynthesis
MLNIENYPVIVSVAMPVYNGEKYLVQAIESILIQTLKDFEFIVIDDGSTDGSLKILQGFAASDHRIRIITRENRGVVATRNELIDNSHGKWIAWMDQDDISHPERLEHQVNELNSQSADICGCHWYLVNRSGKLIDARLVPLTRESFAIYIACAVPFAHGSVMMRASFVKTHALQYGGVTFAEDCDLWIRFWQAGAVFANVNKFIFSYRDTDGTFSKKTKKQNEKETRALRRNFILKNTEFCCHAIGDLSDKYEDLSQLERVYLLLASYLVLVTTKRLILVDVLRRSASKSIGVAILHLYKGI